jgi:coenzyme F420-0:L-glutamate ligase/coenzyme F420-1:gamma-L-glutamate ligase
VSVRLLPVEGLPEVRAGDDLGALLAPALSALGLRTGDVVAVTQKVVSKAEGRVVPEGGGGRAAWVARETRRVVARRDDLVIAETEHGFVCANAGVDASNVEAGFLSLLPVDPDGSAERLREALREGLGVDVGVVITDTFGRAWRRGLVNVAIGCAGIAALVDLRGTLDHGGRELEATVVALADEVAAASGLVMGKASGVPAAIVRGLVDRGLDDAGTPSPARELVRPPEEDLFRESPLVSISARRTIRSFGPGEVPREVTAAAVRAACAAQAPHASRPWSFTALTSPAARRRLAAAVAGAWAADLERDGTSRDEIAERTARTEALLGGAPVLVVPWVRFDAMHSYPDSERSHAEQELFLLSSGAAIENLLLAFHAQGYASCWAPTTLFCQEETREALGVASEWNALGAVAAGPMLAGEGASLPPPPVDLGTVLSDR